MDKNYYYHSFLLHSDLEFFIEWRVWHFFIVFGIFCVILVCLVFGVRMEVSFCWTIGNFLETLRKNFGCFLNLSEYITFWMKTRMTWFLNSATIRSKLAVFGYYFYIMVKDTCSFRLNCDFCCNLVSRSMKWWVAFNWMCWCWKIVI